jgi:hypothetical protein
MSGDHFTGCSCVFGGGGNFPLMARWIAGSVLAPVFHNISGGVFLSVRTSLSTFLGEDVIRFNTVLGSILTIGVTIPSRPITSAVPSLNKNLPPIVSAANDQWRQLLAAAHDATMVQSTCFQFTSASTKEIGYAMLVPGRKSKVHDVVAHGECKSCITARCGFLDRKRTDSFLETYNATFFRPISALFELALKKSWGISSSFYDPRTSPPAQRPGSMSIEEFMKSNG